jgi:hypothetical protein
MPKAVLDKVGITIRRGASPKMWATGARGLNLTPKETSLYYVQETKIFNSARDRYRGPKKGNDNA